jgi:hypothetical protein
MTIIYILLLTSSLLQSGYLTELLYDLSSDDSGSETEEQSLRKLNAQKKEEQIPLTHA